MQANLAPCGNPRQPCASAAVENNAPPQTNARMSGFIVSPSPSAPARQAGGWLLTDSGRAFAWPANFDGLDHLF